MNSKLYTPFYGHFDPLVLSITESDLGKYWRGKVPEPDKSQTFHGKVRTELSRDAETLSDEETLGYLTSWHENDHFRRHVSSEIGLLLTFVLIMRYSSLYGYWREIQTHDGGKLSTARLQNYEQILSHLNTAFLALWGHPDPIPQKEAVEAINWLFTHFNVEAPALTTDTPDYPTSPTAYHGVRNMLESSAMFGEMGYLLCNKYSHERFPTLMRFDMRDDLTYWALYNWLMEKSNHLFPFAATFNRLALDTQVPFFGSPFNGPVDWKDFHPGWRLFGMAEGYNDALKDMGWTPAKIEETIAENNGWGFYLDFFWEDSFRMISDNSLARGYSLNYTENALTFDVNLDSFIGRLSPFGKETLENTVLRTGSVVFKHLFESHEHFRSLKVKNPAIFFADSIIYFEEIPSRVQMDAEATKFVFFSMFDNIIGSVYLLKDPLGVFNVILLHIRTVILDQLLIGTPITTIVHNIFNGYNFQDTGINEMFREYLEEMFHVNFGVPIKDIK